MKYNTKKVAESERERERLLKRQPATSCRLGVVQQATGTQFYTALVAYLLSMRAEAEAEAEAEAKWCHLVFIVV